MKKISHFLRQLNFGLLTKNTFRLKTICSLIFPKCLVVLNREYAWKEEEVVLTNFTIHVTLCLIFNYRRPTFRNWEIGQATYIYIYAYVYTVILETEDNVRKIQKRALFHYKKVKKGTLNLASPYVHSFFVLV